MCPICNFLIGINNYKRHCSICTGKPPQLKELSTTYKIDHTGLNCKFCNKLCKNTNSLIQHEIRCPNNANRRAYNQLGNYSTETRKGQTKYTNPEISAQATKLKQKYTQGYVSPCLGRKISFDYLYKTHNDNEISKWLDYVDTLGISIPKYTTVEFNNSYKVICKAQIRRGNVVEPLFEHNFIANLLLLGNLQKCNTVHHIDNNGMNNDIHNLMVFEENRYHKRFHNSKYAKLVYDENTHLFSCYLDKDSYKQL